MEIRKLSSGMEHGRLIDDLRAVRSRIDREWHTHTPKTQQALGLIRTAASILSNDIYEQAKCGNDAYKDSIDW